MNISIFYEDKDILVINKPANLIVHGDGKTQAPSVADWALEKYPEMKGVGEPLVLQNGTIIERSGIVHRLDRETSGVLVLVKSQKAFEYLKKQFQNRTVAKIYHAYVHGEVKVSEGTIDRPIGKSKSNFRLWSAQRGARGAMRDAVTDYTVLRGNKDFSFVEVRPKTGRTHQIRVHFKAINHPVVCDKLYAPKRPCALSFDRLALHALSITFNVLSGDNLTVEAPLPEDFVRASKLISD